MNVYKKLTLTIAATGLLIPSTVTYAAESTQNKLQTPVSKQTIPTKQLDGSNNQSAPNVETPTTKSGTSNTNDSSQPQKETTTPSENQINEQPNNQATNSETNTQPPTQEGTSQNPTEPKPNEQPESGATNEGTSQQPNGGNTNTETDPTKPDETKPDEGTPPKDGDVDKPEDNNGTNTGQGGGSVPQKGEDGSKPEKPKPDSSGQGEPHNPEQPQNPDEPNTPEMPDTPTTPEMPEPDPNENNTQNHNQAERPSYQPNQQATPVSSYQPPVKYNPSFSNVGSATPSLYGGFNEHQTMNEAMPFSNFGLSGDRFGHLVTGSFKYNPFIVHQVGMISSDTHSTEDDVNALLRPQNFSNNINLNNLQQNTGYFKYQYFSPMRAQQYYANLDLQILGLVTSDLGSMPDLKEVKRDKKDEAEYTNKPSEDTKQNADKAKKSTDEKTADSQKYPRLLNTLMIVFGAAFIWFVILMIMKRKKKSQSE